MVIKLINLSVFLLSTFIVSGQEKWDSIFTVTHKPVFIALEYGTETKGEEDIKSYGLKLDFAHYHRERFATSIESKIRFYNGFRSEIKNETFAIALGYVIKYHFLHQEKMSLFIDCGFGAIYSLDRFPSKGTHFNGQYYLGLGNFIRLKKTSPLLIAARYYHSSNGRGFVTDNPAYDGLFISLGFIL